MKPTPYPSLLAIAFLVGSIFCATPPAESNDRVPAARGPDSGAATLGSLCALAFATIGGGPTVDKLRVDPSGAENAGNEIARFWQANDSSLGNNFGGGCPSQSAEQVGGGWWELNQAPLRGLSAYLGESGCHPNNCPDGPLTVLVEEIAAGGNDAYVIAFQVDPTPAGVRHWDLSRVDPSPSPSVLTMQRFPPVNVTGSSRVGDTITVDMLFADVAPNVHAVSDPGVDTPLPASALVKSYDLYRYVGSWEPGRHAADWTLAEQYPYEDGPTEGSFDIECIWGAEDEFLALGLTFHGGDGPDVKSALVGSAIHLECFNGVIPVAGAGVLEQAENPCVEGAEAVVLTNPCNGRSALAGSSQIDLQQHLCETVWLEGIEMFPSGAFDCDSILAYALEPDDPTCLVQVRELTAEPGPDGLRLEWDALPCSDDYDLVRGRLGELTEGGLGALLCLENDSASLEGLDTTGQDPDPGEAFFYLVRSRGAVGSVQYGHTSAGTPRLPALGDCPVD